MDRPGRTLLRILGLAAFLWLVVVCIAFLLMKLGPTPPLILLGGPGPMPDEQARLTAEYGLDRPAIIQFIRFLLRMLAVDLGRSWLSGASVADELLTRLPATLELMLYAVMLGGLIGVPTGIAAAFARGRIEDRAVRGAALLGEAMPAFLLALLLLLVFFRWLDLAPAPSGRISVVLTPPATITGSYFIDAILVQDSIAARSALAQLILPVFTLGLLIAAALALRVRAAMLDQLGTAHFAYARAQGMSRDMLTAIAFRGALPAIGGIVSGQFAALLGTTALVEYVFTWGGVGQYGLDAMAKADLAAVQGFILLCGLFALLVHAIGGILRRSGWLGVRGA